MTDKPDDQAAGLTQLGKVTGIDSLGEDLERVNDHIWVSRDISNSILVTTPDGNVAINSGMPGNGARHRQRFLGQSAAGLEYLILTQCHADHCGGAHELKDPGTRVIAHERFASCREYWRILDAFYRRRSHKLWASILGERAQRTGEIRELTPDITFRDNCRFELGGRAFELYAAPGGESRDGIIVWLPQEDTLVCGNLFGPLFGNMPNLYTIRGDKIRSAKRFVESLDLVLKLAPETIVTGHEVVGGRDTVAESLRTLRAAVLHVHDYTVAGMNEGRTVYELMREVELPGDLRVGQAHGKLSWCVRAIWEEYAGWFLYDATTSLYAEPGASVAPDIVELAGGNALVERAERYLDQRLPLQALHLIDTVVSVEPGNGRALQAKIAAHELLLDASGGENFSEVMWLKSEIEATRKLLE